MKNPILVVSLVLLLCFVFGCQNKAEKAELEKFRAQAKLEEQNKELFRRMVEEWNKGNYFGIAPTGTRIEASSIMIVRIRNGKFAEKREELNALPLMQQLGMELKPKEVKE